MGYDPMRKGRIFIMKRNRKVVMVIAMTVASLILLYKDTKYMKSAFYYWDARQEMRYVNQLGYQIGWTEHISQMYNEAFKYITESSDPVIILIHEKNIQMKLYTVWVVLRMAACMFWIAAMIRLIQLKIKRCIRRRKRKNRIRK